ncbi:MAG: MFS transporter [Pseudomonadota bacterium]
MSAKPKITLITLFMIIVLDAMGFGIIFPVISPLFMSPEHSILAANVSVNVRDLLYALTLGIFAFFMLFGTPIFGDLSDSYGRKSTLFVCLIGTSVGALLCAFGIKFGSLSLLLFGRALGGMVAGSQPIAQAAIIDVSTEQSKTKNLSLIVLGGSLGFIIGPLIGGYFSDSNISPWFNFSTPFYINAGLAVINAIFLMIFFKDVYQPKFKKAISLTKGIDIFIQALQHKKLKLLIIVLLLSEVAWSTYFQYEGLYLNQIFDFTARQIGNFLTYMACVFMITMLFLIRIFLRFFHEKQIILFSLIIATIGLALLFVFNFEKMHWLAVWPIAIGVGMSYTALLTCFSRVVSKEQQGWVMGVSSAVVAASWILGAVLTGTLGLVSREFPFFVSALLMFFSFILFLRFRE